VADAIEEGPTAPRPGHRRRWRIAAVVAAVALVVVVLLVVRPRSDPSTATDVEATSPRTTVEADTVSIPAGGDIAAAVAAHPPGSTFVLAAGVYREQTITPREGDVFEGAGPGTVLSGARVLTGWERDGSSWSLGGQTQAAPVSGECRDETPLCSIPEELFVDGVRLRPVGSIAALAPDAWWFDRSRGRVHLGSDPTGKVVEIGVTQFAFTGDAGHVTIRDLTVTQYATQSQHGAIQAEGPDWLIERVSAVANHALGIRFNGDRAVIRDTVASENGQMGLGSSSSADSLVERVVLADNNRAGYDDEWEAGGAKFVLSRNLRVVDSDVHGNDGPGIWFDESADASTITGNRVVDNLGAGIFYEISRGATISGNTVTGNGSGEAPKGWLWGAGIQIAASWDVSVTDNTVAGNNNAVVVIQQDRGSGPLGERRADNIEVTGNRIEPGTGHVGAASDVRGSDLFERSIEFRDNTYRVDPAALAFWWVGDDFDLQGWHDLGQD
jgi:parallel beta-helix repeat protein